MVFLLPHNILSDRQMYSVVCRGFENSLARDLLTRGLGLANPRGTFCEGTNGEMEMQDCRSISHSFNFRFPRFGGRVTIKERRGKILPSLGQVLRDLYVESRTSENTWVGWRGYVSGSGRPIISLHGKTGPQASFRGKGGSLQLFQRWERFPLSLKERHNRLSVTRGAGQKYAFQIRATGCREYGGSV